MGVTANRVWQRGRAMVHVHGARQSTRVQAGVWREGPRGEFSPRGLCRAPENAIPGGGASGPFRWVGGGSLPRHLASMQKG
jgi:hypothetical protein